MLRSAFWVLTLLLWVLSLLLIRNGFGLYDNAFYVQSSAYPDDAHMRYSFFDYANAPMYALVGASVRGLRLVAGLLLLLTSGGVLLALRQSLPEPLRERYDGLAPLLLLSAVLTITHLPTPGYNYWTLIALQLSWLGFWLWMKRPLPVREAMLSTLLIGLGTSLLLAGRPTTLLGSALVFLVLTLLRRGFPAHPLRWMATGLLGALPFPLYLLLAAGPPQAHLDSLGRVFRYAVTLQGYSSGLLGTVQEYVQQSARFLAEGLLLAVGPVVLLGLFVLVRQWLRWRRYQAQANRGLLLGLLAAAWTLGLLSAGLLLLNSPYRVGTVGVLLFALALALWWAARGLLPPPPSSASRRVALGSVVAFVLLVSSAFGSNVEYSFVAGFAFFLGLLAVVLWLLLLPEMPRWFMAWLRASLLGLLAFSVLLMLAFPQAQQSPRWEMQTPVVIRQGRDEIVTSEQTGAFYAELVDTAQQAGFPPDTPLMDFTGGIPGLAYILGARTPGYAWFLLAAGDPRPESLVIILDTWEASERRAAWLITTEAEESQSLAAVVLPDYGLRFPQGYRAVGRVPRSPQGSAIVLWEPRPRE